MTWSKRGNALKSNSLTMPHDFRPRQIQQSKREFRQRRAALPIAEKLAMLDALRERALVIRAARFAPESGVLREPSSPYAAQRKKVE